MSLCCIEYTTSFSHMSESGTLTKNAASNLHEHDINDGMWKFRISHRDPSFVTMSIRICLFNVHCAFRRGQLWLWYAVCTVIPSGLECPTLSSEKKKLNKIHCNVKLSWEISLQKIRMWHFASNNRTCIRCSTGGPVQAGLQGVSHAR